MLFQRREQRDWSRLYLCSQLSNVERKTVEGIVLTLVGPDPNAIPGLQQFIGQSGWDSQPLLEAMQRRVAQWWGEPEGVVIVDGSSFPKQGHQSVGVGRQTPRVEGPGRTRARQLRTPPRVARRVLAPHELRAVQAQLPPNAWHWRVIKEGSKGPLTAEFACLRVTPIRAQLPGQRCWAVFRRNLGPRREVKY